MKVKKGYLYGLALVLLFIFTFQDLAISNQLFNPDSAFGWFFESFGELCLSYIGVFSAFALVKMSWQKSKGWSVFYLVLGLFNAFTGAMLNKSYLNLSMIITLLVFAIYLGLFAYFASLIKEKDYPIVKKIAIIGVTLSLVPILFITLVKMIWGRQRYRSMVDPAVEFTPWYAIQHWTTDNERMSFPSGHSANSATMIWITLLPLWLTGLKKYVTPINIFVIVWIICVMLSRIIVGAHFASDVLVGAMTTLILFDILKGKLLKNETVV